MAVLFRKPSKWSCGPVLTGLDRGGGSYTDPERISGHVWGIPIWESTGRRSPSPNAFSHYGQSQGTVIRGSGHTGPAVVLDGTLANHIELNNSANSLRLQKPLPLTVEAIVEKFSTTGAAFMQIVFANCARATLAYSGLTVGISPTDLMIANIGDNSGSASTDRRTIRGTSALANNQIYHLIWSIDTNTTGRFYINGHPETLGVIDGTGGTMGYSANSAAVGGRGMPNALGFDGRIYLVNYFSRPIFDAEALIRARDPWKSYRERDFRY